jgi:hypothetical protein
VLYLGVTGSREVRDRDLVQRELDGASKGQETFLVVGDQVSKDRATGEFYGLDHIAADLWDSPSNPNRSNIRVCTANWERYGKRAGMVRNSEMVKWVLIAKGYNPGSTVRWLAFYQTGAQNKGTAHCANTARRAGIPVTEIWVPK